MNDTATDYRGAHAPRGDLSGDLSGDADAVPVRPGFVVLTVAHRAGNDVVSLRTALAAGVDLVEADAHYVRGRLELRHRKTLGPGLLWDRWEVVRRSSAVPPRLPDVVATLDGDARLMLDLKGIHPGLAPAVATLLHQRSPSLPLTVCTQHWWMLDAFAHQRSVRLILSAGSRRRLGRLRTLLRDRPRSWPGRRRPFGVSIHRGLLTPDLVKELRRGTEHVLTWPVDTPDHLADARRLGVTGIIGKDLVLFEGFGSPAS